MYSPCVTERGVTRVRSADGKWRHKAETVNTPRRKDAERILAQRFARGQQGAKAFG